MYLRQFLDSERSKECIDSTMMFFPVITFSSKWSAPILTYDTSKD